MKFTNNAIELTLNDHLVWDTIPYDIQMTIYATIYRLIHNKPLQRNLDREDFEKLNEDQKSIIIIVLGVAADKVDGYLDILYSLARYKEE